MRRRRWRLGDDGGVTVVELEGMVPELPGGAVEREEPSWSYLGEDGRKHHIQSSFSNYTVVTPCCSDRLG